MKIHFYKYQGTGNDFVILDNREGQYNSLQTTDIRRLCDRRFGIGADGLIRLTLHPSYDFQMDYFNSDGKESSMCGNGGRCLAAFAHTRGLFNDKARFVAADGEHEALLLQEGWVELKMQDVRKIERKGPVCILNTGSPHYVQFVTNVQKIDVFSEGRQIRYSDPFAKEGINVNFVERKDQKLLVRTYERGVENETYSCGTGVTASAIASAGEAPGSYVVPIQTLGGHLEVKFEKISDQHYANVWLCGPATFVFEGDIAT